MPDKRVLAVFSFRTVSLASSADDHSGRLVAVSYLWIILLKEQDHGNFKQGIGSVGCGARRRSAESGH